MRKVGFIGASDKTNLIMYVAKIFEIIGKKVIVVDTTITQKMKYLAPTINPTKTYITNFENIDFAVGFESINDLTQYLGLEREENLQYDYMLIDIDNYKTIDNFEVENTKDNFFVSAFDMYSLKKGVEILRNISEPMNLSRVLYDYNIKKEDEEYLDYLSLDTKVAWSDFNIYIPVMGTDKQVIEENQRVCRIRFKRLTPEYQEGILYIVQSLENDVNISKVKKMIKE